MPPLKNQQFSIATNLRFPKKETGVNYYLIVCVQLHNKFGLKNRSLDKKKTTGKEGGWFSLKKKVNCVSSILKKGKL